MKISFNLLSQPWIPCIQNDGSTVELGLFETLSQAHEFHSLEGDSPLETASLIRLLLAVLHRVVDTHNQDSWMDIWQTGHFSEKALESYLRQWENRFDLFDEEHPFYQQRHDLVDPWAAIKLLPGMSAVPLYYHAVETEESRYTPAQAARILITAHTFATPGIRNPQKNLFFNGGPWLSGKVFFLEGNSLFQTLMLNLLRYAPDHPDPNLCQTDEDAPAWEMDNPFFPERTLPLGYLDYLTWQNRRVYLIPVEEEGQIWVKEVVEAPGLKLQGEIRDPMKAYIRDEKKGFKMLYLDKSKALWRQSSAFLDIKSKDRRPPQALLWAADLIEENDLPVSMKLRLMTVGVVVENNSKIVLHRMERMPLPLQILENTDLALKLRKEVDYAENVKNQLFFAVNTMAGLLISADSDLPDNRRASNDDIKKLMAHWHWEDNYWPPLEFAFYDLVQDLADNVPEAISIWRKIVQSTAQDSLEDVIHQIDDSAKGLKAAVQARSVLFRGLIKLESNG